MPSSMTAMRGPTLALLSAALFGASTPLAKMLLGQGVDAWLLAGLLYLASGLGLALVFVGRRIVGRGANEAPLRGADLPVLALVVLFGGILGPLLLMQGLAHMQAAPAALLLNLESLFTLIIAWTVFHEYVDLRLLIGAGTILIGAALLSWPQGGARVGYAALMVAAACLCWALDNNLTRKLSGADPVQIACLKGLVAGSINLGIARLGGEPMPHAVTLSLVAIVGFLGYGASLVLFVLALRHLGTARTGAYYATAPFIGALLAVLLLHDPLSVRLLIAGALMAVGVYLHLTEGHVHEHMHEALVHEHRHSHDEMHDHAHGPDDPEGEPHSHPHEHAPLVHSHPHYPDLHHRHRHS
ncbi:MAG TPA: EamA family transporter [Steroidobacteraceae bacterium]|nr:EamA family transporter [Steroidobacteraceae bacterium]